MRSARLAVGDKPKLPPGTALQLSASIVYQFGEAPPENAGIVLALREGGNPQLLTSNTVGDLLPGRGILLTPDQPRAHQTLELEIPRSAIPIESGTEIATAELVWKGGALQTLAASPETTARVVIAPEGLDRLTVSVNGNIPVHRSNGTADVRFDVPFVVTCEQERCFSDLEADFELLGGPWLILDWSNYIPGLRTKEGDVWVRGWHLRTVEP
jgi:hypothetical protein